MHHGPLEIEPQHHVEVVGDLVGLDADEGRPHGQQRLLEAAGIDVGKRGGKRQPGAREAPFPERSRPPHEILPEP